MARRLNDVDKQFVLDNASTKTDEEIAKILGCSSRSVSRIRSEQGVSKRVEEANTTLKKIADLSDVELAEHYRRQFELSPRGKRIRTLINADDYEAFMEQWVGFHLQLEDVTHAEQNTIEQIIMLKLRMDQNQREYKTQLELQQKLLKDAGVISIDDLDLSDPDQAMMSDKITMCGVQAVSLGKDYKETLDRVDKLAQSLNVTRRQREEKGRIGGDTFFSKCQEFAQRAIREKEGRLAEILRVATVKKTDNLRGAIRYMDGETAPQLLDSNTVIEMEKQNEHGNKTELELAEPTTNGSISEPT